MAKIDVLTATARDLQDQLIAGDVTSKELVQIYLEHISKYNDRFRGVLSVAPTDYVYKVADTLDQERGMGMLRGPLHGIPILLKDNIATDPEMGMDTTAGSLALSGSVVPGNAVVTQRLVDAGLIIIGKASLSEWAYYKGENIPCGWNAVSGQAHSPYIVGGVDPNDAPGGQTSPGGSSAGSATSVAAGFAPLSIGSETCGSLTMPADRAALYTIKPTTLDGGIVSGKGVIPISKNFDSTGPMTKCVWDEAVCLDAMVEPSKAIGKPEGGYVSCLKDPSWGSLRIGYVEPAPYYHHEPPVGFASFPPGTKEQMVAEINAAYDKLKTMAATVKKVDLKTYDETSQNKTKNLWGLLTYDFKRDLENYFAELKESKVKSLEELVKFNEDHREQELPPGKDNQARILDSVNSKMTQQEYDDLLAYNRRVCGREGIDKILADDGVDVIIGPADSQLYYIAAAAGSPIATLPLGYIDYNGRPFALAAMASPHQDAVLIRVQAAWEATFPARKAPPLDEVYASLKA
ncbi:amidase family protein [Rhizodiscina lignyota]|uniref:Amidase family protein n=1 Tax=Rhizodiscina lignyota TaxID=1504668 RepID=A0A9P4M5Z9_9PEZI|nr:amidase family protein [Rhizodiscina lignyota]